MVVPPLLANWHLSAGISSRCEEHKAPLVIEQREKLLSELPQCLSIDDDLLLLFQPPL